MHEAANTLDAIMRLATLQRAEALLLEEAPIAPLVFNSRTFLIHPAVKNWQPALLGINRYHVVELRN